MPINFKVEDGVAAIEIAGRTHHNAFTYDMYAELERLLFDVVDPDPDIQAAVLYGGGGQHFSVGHDLKAAAEQQAAGQDQDVYQVRPFYFAPLPRSVTERVRTPVVGALYGWALAAGVLAIGMQMAIRIAGESTKLGYTEIKRAMAGAGALSNIWSEIPYAVHAYLAATGEPLDAATGLRIGFYNEVLPDDQVLPRAFSIARRIAEGARLSIRAEMQAEQLLAPASLRQKARFAANVEAFLGIDPGLRAQRNGKGE